MSFHPGPLAKRPFRVRRDYTHPVATIAILIAVFFVAIILLLPAAAVLWGIK